MPRPLDAEIIAEHVSEIAFLWRVRDLAAASPGYDASDLAALDERIDAHLDGVRIADEAGIAACEGALDPGEPGTAFGLAVFAIERGDGARLEAALAIADQAPSASRGVVTALAWSSANAAAPVVRDLLGAGASARRRLGIAASSARREDVGAALGFAVEADDPRLRARALRAIGELGRVDLAREARAAIASEDEGCAFWAAWSSTLLGDAGAADALWRVGEGSSPLAPRAAATAVRAFDARTARERIETLGAHQEHARAALMAAAAYGDPALVPFVLAHLDAPESARAAADAFARITGAAIVDELAGDAAAHPSAEDEDDETDPDEALPWPNPAAITRAWSATLERRLSRGTRYVGGSPLSGDALRAEIERGPQHRRASAAIELALLERGRPLAEVRARGGRAVPR
ncbi:MAG: TIGR02270 family protein [Polyangiaceae bacterium]